MVTPASRRKLVSCARPVWVVANRSFSTSIAPVGWVILVQATTLSRWTSRPPTLSRICFLVSLLVHDVFGGRRERTTGETESRVRARSDNLRSHSPAPHYVHARSGKY